MFGDKNTTTHERWIMIVIIRFWCAALGNASTLKHLFNNCPKSIKYRTITKSSNTYSFSCLHYNFKKHPCFQQVQKTKLIPFWTFYQILDRQIYGIIELYNFLIFENFVYCYASNRPSCYLQKMLLVLWCFSMKV